MAFNGAQVFFVAPGVVQNSPEIGISGVDLFFKTKPNANNNQSGIQLPGVCVSIIPTVNGVPDVTRMTNAPLARNRYVTIKADPTAQTATRFEFLPPVQVATNSYYAFVVQVDDPAYQLWGVTVGEAIVGSGAAATGPGGSYVGSFYNFNTAIPTGTTNNSSNSILSQSGNSSGNSGFIGASGITGTWVPKINFDLKFTVYAARYSFNGNSQLSSFTNVSFLANGQIVNTAAVVHNSNGEVVYSIPALRYEYAGYASGNSSNVGVLSGERVYQNTVFYPGGTATPARVSVVQGSSNLVAANAAVVNWSTLLQVGGADPEYIVVTSGNALGAGASLVNVRQVTGLISNTVITVDKPFTFTNAVANFFRTPVAIVDQWMQGKIFGVDQSVMVLANSSANFTMRFVNDSIIAASINAIGASYTNTDYFTVTGYEAVTGKVIGGYAANGNINTFANGSLANVYMANLGAGFVNSSTIAVTFFAANGASSNGSGATLATTVGSTICSELLGLTGTGGFFTQCKILNIEIGNEVVGLGVNNPSGTVYQSTEYLPYYSVDDTATVLGKTYYCDLNTSADIIDVQFGQTVYPWSFTKRRTMMSWSNELITPFANGSNSNGCGGFVGGATLPVTSNGSILYVNAISNSDFQSVAAAPNWSTITFSRYIINNDYTNENTNYGNAWARGIEAQFNLANSSFAEDIVVYSTCYRPAVANVIAFARLYNSGDPDSFQDKQWTMLDLVGGNTVFSSPTDPSDAIELTWGLQPYPNTSVLAGTASTTNAESNIHGSGTSWKTNTTINLASGDLIVIYQPLFSNTDYQVAVVDTVTSDVLFSIQGTTTNNDILGSGMGVAKVTYPHQAFKNAPNAGIVRYYNSQMVPFDGYDVCQMKLVMLSSNGTVVPIITDIRTVAVSS